MSALRRAFSKPVSEAELAGYVSGFRTEGYQGLQLKSAQYEQYLDAPQRALDELGTDAGIYSGLIMGDSLDRDGLARIDTTIEFAAAVGAERIIFCHGHPHEGVDRELRRVVRCRRSPDVAAAPAIAASRSRCTTTPISR